MQAATVTKGNPALKGMELYAIPAILLGLGLMLAGKWLLMVKQLAFVRLASGFSQTLDDALKVVRSRQWSMAAVFLLIAFTMLAVAALWTVELMAAAFVAKDRSGAIPGILAMFIGATGMIASTGFISVVLFLALSAVACEKQRATSLISKVFSLASKSFFRTLFMGIVISVTISCLSSPLWLPVLVFLLVDSIRMGAEIAGEMPIHWHILISTWESLIDILVWPVTFLAYGAYYNDLRVRNEGLDVLNSLDKIKQQQEEKVRGLESSDPDRRPGFGSQA